MGTTYVDDMLILGNTLDVVNKTKEFLSSQFEMKDFISNTRSKGQIPSLSTP